MGSGVIVVLVLLGLLVAGGLAYGSYLAAKRRREAFAALAAAHGWVWTERDDRWAARFDATPFGTGRDRRASNVLTGAHDGRPLVAFDYRYSTTRTTTVNGRTQHRTEDHPFSVVGLDAGARFPELAVSPQGFWNQIVDAVTGNDIDFESADFNDAFTVTCPDRKFASDVIHPRMMELLMRAPDLAWRFTDGWALVIRKGSHSEAEVTAKLARLDAIVDQVPDFVWRDVLGSVPPAQPSQRADPPAPPDPT